MVTCNKNKTITGVGEDNVTRQEGKRSKEVMFKHVILSMTAYAK